MAQKALFCFTVFVHEFYCIFWVTAFELSTTFWCNFVKRCCHKMLQKLSALKAVFLVNQKCLWNWLSGTVFTKRHFLLNLGPISQSVTLHKAKRLCSDKHQLIRNVRKLQRKWCVVHFSTCSLFLFQTSNYPEQLMHFLMLLHLRKCNLAKWYLAKKWMANGQQSQI